jgi:hypothetical protein
MVGGKVVRAKILNGRLLIRTGGGYITFHEFLSKYAKPELEDLKDYAKS